LRHVQRNEEVLSGWQEAAGIAERAKSKITDKDFTGLKDFEKLLPLFARWHEVGYERDTAGNRDLHFDEYCVLVLLFFQSDRGFAAGAAAGVGVEVGAEETRRAANVAGIVLGGAASVRSRIAAADHRAWIATASCES
jgi:hypothetical protein